MLRAQAGWTTIVAGVAVLSLPGAAFAQAASTEVEQLSAPRIRNDGRLPAQLQVAPHSAADRSTASNVDSGNRADPAVPVAQLTERRDRRSAPQLYQGERTAQPSDPLSTPSQGRTSAVVRVEGVDACDPAQRADRRNAPGCARVIETRSAEFAPPAPTPLSPEQRLLIEGRTRGLDAERGAVRRLANSGAANGMADQAIASVVLEGAAPTDPVGEPENPAQNLDPAVAALVEAIARQVTPP